MGVLFDYATGNETERERKTFKGQAAEDIHGVFLNAGEFAEHRVIKYDGETYEDVLVVPVGPEETRRTTLTQSWSDHTQGLYKRKLTLYLAISDLGGKLPEKGTILTINEREGSGFFQRFRVANSEDEGGMALTELEEIDE